MKSISTINPATSENTERSIVKAHSLFIDLKVGVMLIMVYNYALFHI